MWDDSERDKLRRLGEMYECALQRCNGNHIEARETMSRWLPRFRDYDEADPHALAQRVAECRNSGARLNLDDPRLKPGGDPRFFGTTGRRY